MGELGIKIKKGMKAYNLKNHTCFSLSATVRTFKIEFYGVITMTNCGHVSQCISFAKHYMTVLTDTINWNLSRQIRDVIRTRRTSLTKRKVHAVSVGREGTLRELRKGKIL